MDPGTWPAGQCYKVAKDLFPPSFDQSLHSSDIPLRHTHHDSGRQEAHRQTATGPEARPPSGPGAGTASLGNKMCGILTWLCRGC